jgi:hypothetical protein
MPIPLISPQLTAGVSKMLWDFGFRWHPELQNSWIEGVAGLGTVANLVDEKPEETDFKDGALDFLEANNPELMEAIRNVKPEERDALIRKLEKSFGELQGLIDALKEG